MTIEIPQNLRAASERLDAHLAALLGEGYAPETLLSAMLWSWTGLFDETHGPDFERAAARLERFATELRGPEAA